MKKILSFILISILFVSLFGCEKNKDTTKLSFKSASSYEYLSTLNGKKVEINGYMATSSPVDGSFIFLMNLPYQNCPFCKPNTSELSNTMEVYPKKNTSFTYTTQAIKVIGTLDVAPKDNSFTDMYGYEFNFKIVDAEYKILSDDDISSNISLWQKVADASIINDLYTMYDYINFVCDWPNYFVNSYTGSDGVVHPGYYLYASDAINYIEKDGGQWNYGFKDGYFDSLINRLKKIDAKELDDLIKNVEKAKALANDAYLELKNGEYTYEYKYVSKFKTEDYVYTLNKGVELTSRLSALFNEFSDWISSFEM